MRLWLARHLRFVPRERLQWTAIDILHSKRRRGATLTSFSRHPFGQHSGGAAAITPARRADLKSRTYENSGHECTALLHHAAKLRLPGARQVPGYPEWEVQRSTIPKSFLLRQESRMGQTLEALDIGLGLSRIQRPVKHGRVRCNALLAHHGRPAKAEQFILAQAGSHKGPGPVVVRTV